MLHTTLTGGQMKKLIIRDIALLGLTTAFLTPAVSTAGDLEPPAGPEAKESAMYSTEAIWQRLHSGIDGEQRNGAFVVPGVGPGVSVGKTLDEIMTVAPAVAPVADYENAALPDDVDIDKTYWGLRSDSTWGLQAGKGNHPASSIPAPVPKSGQVALNIAGDDGDKQKGVPLPSPRFTAHSNGTVTDNLTGLVWLKDANCFETVGLINKADPGTLSWADALTWSNQLAHGFCHLSDGSVAGDWRLPNKRELFSLVNYAYFSPALSDTLGTAKWTEGNPFSNVKSESYWSSTTYYNSDAALAWGVDLDSGNMLTYSKVNTKYVWPVRGGQ